MIKEIKYNGLTATPSDYNSLDGDLAAMANLIPEDGALKPIASPATVFQLSSGENVVHIHETSSFTHYIIQDTSNALYWRTKDGSARRISNFGSEEIYQITSIGNTLVTLCSDGMHYALWSTDNNNYTYLGNKIPECPISFGLHGVGKLYSELPSTDNSTYGTFTINYDDASEDKANIATQILAKVNKFIAEVSTDKGKFMYPFFVRYAYRLYDGSLSHHSAPILMVPCTGANPFVFAPSGSVGSSSAELDIYAVVATLDYQPLISSSERTALGKWSDIVKSVDIFISAPIYTYDQSGTEVEYYSSTPIFQYYYGCFAPQSIAHLAALNTYQQWEVSDLYRLDKNISYNTPVLSPGWVVPTFPKPEVDSKIRDCSAFYFLTSVAIEDLPSGRVDVDIDDGALASIVAHEPMKDDYQTHDTLVPSFAQVYNNRLNIANIERRLFEGYDTAAQVAYCSGYLQYTANGLEANPSVGGNSDIYLYTTIQADKTITVRNTCSTPLSVALWNYPYLFYPDTSVKSMTLSSSTGAKTIKAEPHPLLNGSVCYRGLGVGGSWDYYYPSESGTPIVSLPNKIYTSEVNNPFFFPLTGINTVGTGEIMGISTAAKALSQGQFGQFPLYAFTTDGVWALEVSTTGSYSAKQPITRDVCLSAESITQIDSAVLFATARGIMLLSGSESICISDVINSEEPFALLELPHGGKLMEFANLIADNVNYIPFKEYVQGCRMAYDYINQRIYVFNPAHRYAYIYSLESKAWGAVASDIVSSLNSYPESVAMDRYNRLVDLSVPVTTSDIRGFLISRPLKMDYADILKTVNAVIQRGRFRKGNVKVVMYGSRDLINWFMVNSSTDHYLRGFSGTAYKYFRIAVISSLNHDESLSGCTVQYELKQTNQPR